MKKIIMLILVSLALAPLAPLAYCQDEMAQDVNLFESMDGEVVSVDAVKGVVVIKDMAGKKTEIKIQPETQILKSDKQVKLSDINIVDKVTVEYRKDALNNYTAVIVTVK